jgi:hypothetical protein
MGFGSTAMIPAAPRRRPVQQRFLEEEEKSFRTTKTREKAQKNTREAPENLNRRRGPEKSRYIFISIWVDA